MISYNDYFKELINNIPIEDVFNKLGYKIEKKGNYKKVLCPFHNDTNPSLVLYKDHYHCYACGAHGNIFEIVKHNNGYSFNEALVWIEEMFPQYRRRNINFREYKKEIYENGFDLAFKTYEKMDSNENEKFGSFAKERGFEPDFLKKSQVYYSAGNKLCNKHKDDIRNINLLLDKYLIKRKIKTKASGSEEYLDVFHNDRIVLTLRGLKGEILGFVGRAIAPADKPKYLFTKNLQKSKMLYRLDNVKNNNLLNKEHDKEPIELYIVEGTFDALRLESLKYNATSVLGSHITKGQVEVLADYIEEVTTYFNVVKIHLFLDSDKAGIKGIYQSIKNLWQNKYTRGMYIDVIINKEIINENKHKTQNQILKDPDAILMNMSREEVDLWLKNNTISVFEFLLRYFDDVEKLNFETSIFEEHYCGLELNDRILLLNKVVSIIPDKYWSQIIAFYSSLGIENEDFSFDIIKNYINGSIVEKSKDTHDKYNRWEKSNNQLMNHALQIAQKSYRLDDLPIDSFTWDRIQQCADAFYPFFYEQLENKNKLELPMIAINVPKNSEEYRLRTLFNHERLILQQYILNELLRSDKNRDYEKFIPAVRYNPNLKNPIYTTGLDYYNHFDDMDEKSVSFAYQVNMTAINGDTVNGMFRHYYESWKSFINYLEEGIRKLDSDKIFRVRLDIKGFYDNIPMRAIRNVLIEPLKQAIGLNEQFDKILKDKSDDDKAKYICDWLLGELFHYEYMDPATGEIKKFDSAIKGIPQGPNLSAYLANIALFPLDKAVSQYVNKINSENTKNGKGLAIRYARYVDDMIIISTDSKYLNDVKDIIIDELSNIELILSEKTDDAEKVDKEEAFEWLIDEKGGLGSSAIFDGPEEPIEDIITDYQSFEIINRREALKILRNMVYDFEFTHKEDREDLIELFFRTKEARYSDAKRFGLFLLRHIIREDESDVISRYNEIWEKYRLSAHTDSTIRREEIKYLTLLDAFLSILSEDISFKLSTIERENRIKDKKVIMNIVTQQNFIKMIKRISSNVELKKNYYIIKLKNLAIFNQVLKNLNNENYEVYEDIRNNLEKNCLPFIKENTNWDEITIYEKRLIFSIIKEVSTSNIENNMLNFYITISNYSNKTKSLELFHWVTSYIIAMKDEKSRFNEMRRLLSEQNRVYSDDVFEKCIELWFSDEEIQDDKEKPKPYLRIAINVFLNIVHNSIKAELIDDNPVLRDYLFKVNKEKVDYLPVPPGVEYPGILALNIKDKLVKRVDFIKAKDNYEYQFTDKLIWKSDSSNIDNLKFYKANTKEKWENIDDYINKNYKNKSGKMVKEIVRIYKELKTILDTDKTNPIKPILSKHHIFVTENGEIKILSYMLEYSQLNSSVAISNGNNSLKVIDVPHIGAIYWQIAYVLEDVLRTDRYIFTGEVNSEEVQVEKMLSYSFKRLKGDWMNRSSLINSMKSYDKTVENTLKHLEEFSEAENKQIYILDCIIINRFINYRMKKNIDKPGEVEYHLGIWAKSTLNHEYNELLELFKDDDNSYFIKFENMPLRRVPLSYYLIAKRLSNKIDKNKVIGLRALISGLFINSIMVNLKMQVLERVIRLEKIEYENLLQKDFPIEFLGIDITEVSIVKDANDEIEELKDIARNLCNKRHDNRINRILPIGWLLLLCWILEIYEQVNYVTSIGMKRNKINGKDVNINELKKELPKLAKNLTLMDSYRNEEYGVDDEYKDAVFPFDNINKCIDTWNDDMTSSKAYKILNQIDDLDNVKIDVEVSKYFNYVKLDRNKVEVNLPSKGYHSLPAFFITDGIIGGNGKRKDVDSLTQESKWSQTTINNEVVGISVVSYKLAMLSNINEYKETGHQINNKQDKKIKEDVKNKENLNSKEEIKQDNAQEHTSQEEQRNIEENCKKEDRKISKHENNEENKMDLKDKEIGLNNKDCKFRNIIREIDKIKRDKWKERKKQFSTYNRIAFFQFEVDNSYEHPIVEICNNEKIGKEEKKGLEYKKFKTKWDPNELMKEDESLDGATKFLSCAEFRRRKLLEKVLEVCSYFDVEILLLPEYSVRPETVEWLKKEIDNQNYKISVWAGTLRLVPNRNLSSEVFEDILNSPNYDWSALLPIVVHNEKDINGTDLSNKVVKEIETKSRVICDRIKKYPAISLQEVINPDRPKDRGYIDAVIKKRYDEHLFGDARDSVIELICAELFMIASPSNIHVLAKASYDLYQRFNTGNHLKFEEYYKEAIKDVIKFGERTAVHQRKNKYGRTPIILVPAYTTRAIDYYVTAQAGYLASGLTTVFCNAVGINTIGGSCFIGTDSWDDKNGNKSDTLPDYFPYHGLTPGIYHQFSQHKDRGALGKEEQALVICDVNPISFKGKPNPQTLGSTLKLVAHLPIIESNKLDKMKKDDKDYSYYCRCEKFIARCNKNRLGHCKDPVNCQPYDDLMKSILELSNYIIETNNNKKRLYSTLVDEHPSIIKNALTFMGKNIRSDWLRRRGEVYIEQHINNPQSWPPPTVLDWIWVDIDYENEYKKEKIKIDIPKFASIEKDK